MASPATPSYLGVRERWLTAGLLGIGLIAFAINAFLALLCIAPALLAGRRAPSRSTSSVPTGPSESSKDETPGMTTPTPAQTTDKKQPERLS